MDCQQSGNMEVCLQKRSRRFPMHTGIAIGTLLPPVAQSSQDRKTYYSAVYPASITNSLLSERDQRQVL